MSDGSLSQEEINALFAASDNGGDSAPSDSGAGSISSEEMDTMGEVANICMGTAATALFSLVNKKVEISTPVVSEATWDDVIEQYEKPCVLIRIGYTKVMF